MAENMFAIFPDRQLASGHAGKGGVIRSKKTALCDVKNTLLSKQAALNEPLRKVGQPSPLETPCKPLEKDNPVKETPGKVTSIQGGTFAIACDEKENQEWGGCGGCRLKDGILDARCPSEHLKTADIRYLSKGLLSLSFKEKENHLDLQCLELVDEEPVSDFFDDAGFEIPETLEPLLFTMRNED